MPFRAATEADYPRIAQIVHDAFALPAHRFGTGSACPIYPPGYDVDRLQRDRSAGYEFFVYEQDRHALACVALRQARPGEMELARLAVPAGLEHRGIGSQLVAGAVQLARQQGNTV